jgi:hypothetical protein
MVQATMQRQQEPEPRAPEDGHASLRAYRNQLIAELREVNRLLEAGRIVPTGSSGFAT